MPKTLSRRHALLLSGAGLLLPVMRATAQEALRVRWTDLIPEGVAYGQIIARGEVDTDADIWIPVFDENGSVLRTDLDGQTISLAGYVIPLEVTSAGTTSFVLVPFIGACIHVPPPPPNQLVFVNTATPWPSDKLWEAVLVTGTLTASVQRTEIAEVGYEIAATVIEKYQA